MANRSLFVQGLAGTGKTTLVKKLVQALTAKGERVTCCAFTHVAAKNIGGCTLHHFAHKHILNGSYKGWLVVDEMGQLTLPLVAALNRMLMNEGAGQPVRFILLGDFMGQLLSIQNSWRGQAVDNDFLRDSALLKQLAGYNRITLTRCRRSDEKLFGFYASLIEGGSRACSEVQDAVSDARRLFPDLPGEATWNLAISHRRRKQICKRINDAESAQKPRVLAPFATKETAQEIWVFEGLVLVGCTKQRWVRNGGFYKVVQFDEGETTFEDMDAPGETEPEDGETDESPRETGETAESPRETGALTLKTEEITKCLRIAACLTYSACRSRTLPGRLRLWDVGHTHFTKPHLNRLNVGLSRGTSCELIDLRE